MVLPVVRRYFEHSTMGHIQNLALEGTYVSLLTTSLPPRARLDHETRIADATDENSSVSDDWGGSSDGEYDNDGDGYSSFSGEGLFERPPDPLMDAVREAMNKFAPSAERRQRVRDYFRGKDKNASGKVGGFNKRTETPHASTPKPRFFDGQPENNTEGLPDPRHARSFPLKTTPLPFVQNPVTSSPTLALSLALRQL